MRGSSVLGRSFEIEIASRKEEAPKRVDFKGDVVRKGKENMAQRRLPAHCVLITLRLVMNQRCDNRIDGDNETTTLTTNER